MTTFGDHRFWADPPRGAVSEQGRSIFEKIGAHSQVTDAYLLTIVAHHQGLLATFDMQLKSLFGPRVELLTVEN